MEIITRRWSFEAVRSTRPSGEKEIQLIGEEGFVSTEETCSNVSKSQNFTVPSDPDVAKRNSFGWKSIESGVVCPVKAFNCFTVERSQSLKSQFFFFFFDLEKKM